MDIGNRADRRMGNRRTGDRRTRDPADRRGASLPAAATCAALSTMATEARGPIAPACAEGNVMPYSDDASQQRNDATDTQATQAYNPFPQEPAQGAQQPAPVTQPTQPVQQTQAVPPTQPMQSTPTQQTQPLQGVQPTQPLQQMATQQLADPYAGRRKATQSMDFAARPSVLPTSATEDALMGATGVMGAPIGSVQARDAAETQVLQPTAGGRPTVPMGAAQAATVPMGTTPMGVGETETIAMQPGQYGASTQTVSYGRDPYATAVYGTSSAAARTPRSAQSAQLNSSATPGYAGYDDGSDTLEDTPAYGAQAVGSQQYAGQQYGTAGYAQPSYANAQTPGDKGGDADSLNSSHQESKSKSSKKTAVAVAIIVVVLIIVGIAVALGRRGGSTAGQGASSSSATSALAACQESVNRYNDSRNRWNSVVSDASATSAVTADQVQDASTVANLQLALKATVPDLTQCDTSATDAQLQQTTSLNNDAADTLQKNADAVTAAAQKVTDSKSAKDSADASAQASASQQQQQEDAQKLAQAQSDLKSAIDTANAELSEAQDRLGASDPDVQQFQQEIAAAQKVADDSSADYATVTGSTSTLASATSYMKRRVDSAPVDADADPNSPSASASGSTDSTSSTSSTADAS